MSSQGSTHLATPLNIIIILASYKKIYQTTKFQVLSQIVPLLQNLRPEICDSKDYKREREEESERQVRSLIH